MAKRTTNVERGSWEPRGVCFGAAATQRWGRKGQVLRGSVGTLLAGTPGSAQHHTHDLASLTAPSPTHDTTTTTTSSFAPHSLTHRINKILLLSSSSSSLFSTYFWCLCLGIYRQQITTACKTLPPHYNFSPQILVVLEIRKNKRN